MLCTSGFVDDVIFPITARMVQAVQVGCKLKLPNMGQHRMAESFVRVLNFVCAFFGQ